MVSWSSNSEESEKKSIQVNKPRKVTGYQSTTLCVSLCTEHKRGGEDIKDISFKTTSKPVKCL